MTAETDDEPPIVKLVNAIMLSAIKKRVRFVTILPGVVWFGTDAGWVEEMRPPYHLETLLVSRFSELLDVSPPEELGEWVAGPFVLLIGEGRRESFALRIERIRQGTWILVERLNDLEYAKRIKRSVVEPAALPVPIPGQRFEGDDVVFDTVRW